MLYIPTNLIKPFPTCIFVHLFYTLWNNLPFIIATRITRLNVFFESYICIFVSLYFCCICICDLLKMFILVHILSIHFLMYSIICLLIQVLLTFDQFYNVFPSIRYLSYSMILVKFTYFYALALALLFDKNLWFLWEKTKKLRVAPKMLAPAFAWLTSRCWVPFTAPSCANSFSFFLWHVWIFITLIFHH